MIRALGDSSSYGYWTAPAPAPGAMSTLDVAHGVSDFLVYGLALLSVWTVVDLVRERKAMAREAVRPRPRVRRRRRK